MSNPPQQPKDTGMEHKVGQKLRDGTKVYAITRDEIMLGEVEIRQLVSDSLDTCIRVNGHRFTSYGSGDEGSNIVLVHPATEDNREKLVALFGEAQVPPLPPQGSAITKALLDQGRFTKAWVSDVSDGKAREYKNIELLVPTSSKFLSVQGNVYAYAVAFDDFGNEITELPNM